MSFTKHMSDYKNATIAKHSQGLPSCTQEFINYKVAVCSPPTVGIYITSLRKLYTLWKNQGKVKQLFSQPTIFSLIGLTVALSVITHFLAVNIIEVPYVISVKRTSLLFGIMFGAFWFKEKNIRERLIGSIVMIIGVIVIALF